MKILVVGDPASIHTARFVGLLQELGHDVHLFQSGHGYLQDEQLRDTTVYVSHPIAPPKHGNRLIVTYPLRFAVRPGTLLEKPLRRLARVLNAKRSRSAELSKLITRLSPQLIFSLKMQPDGYSMADASAALGDGVKIPWIHFCWGTDIEFFGKHPDFSPTHLPRIRSVLERCNYLMADTHRDIRQAREFGFDGTTLGAFLAHGGFDLGYLRGIRSTRSERRDVILVKGREGSYVGHGMNILNALDRIADRLSGFRIVVMLASPDVKSAVAKMAQRHPSLSYEIAENLPYEALLTLYASSRIAISATDVDGTPSFLVEAMALGALPIHSDMGSVREWVEHGTNALLFPVNDVDALTAAIERGLNDDGLCKTAEQQNWAIAEARMDRTKIRQEIGAIIESLTAPDRGERRKSLVLPEQGRQDGARDNR